jgi:hypothetical protein
MCYDYDFEMLKRAYVEELARRNREKKVETAKPDKVDSKPTPAPQGKEPVPA